MKNKKTHLTAIEREELSRTLAKKIDDEILGGGHTYDQGLIFKMIDEVLCKVVASAYQDGKQIERENIKSKVGFLRQWLNQRSNIYIIQNSDIEHWLGL